MSGSSDAVVNSSQIEQHRHSRFHGNDDPARRRPDTKRAPMTFAMLTLWVMCSGSPEHGQSYTVGSKKFTESYVLSEIAKRQLINDRFQVEHKQGMGGTIILWQALKTGAISAYPEYTGTITEEILKVKKRMTLDEMRAALAKDGIGITGDLGFNDTYALVMRPDRAKALGVHDISDLKKQQDLVVGIDHEYLKRQDGWSALTARYSLRMSNVKGIDHGLIYSALAGGTVDISDVYSTDAKIGEMNLLTLRDDLGFFPQYKAVFLYRLDTDPKVVAS